MKVICEKKREINTVTSCRNEFCCKELKKAFEDIKDGRHYYYSSLSIDSKSNKVQLTMHSSSDGYTPEGQKDFIDYCPFCGAKLTIEQIQIDNTGLPPESPKIKSKIKNHWWN